MISHGGLEIDKSVINTSDRLQIIANYGVGFNNIDVEYAASKNITVTNTPQSVFLV